MKTRSHFQFQRFAVADDQCSMKVGTDAVLLAAWAEVQSAHRILDIGSGSGVIALVAAQRTSDSCLIDGIEIQSGDCNQAASNVASSPWSHRIQMICCAIQDHHPAYQYDVILCNPPYFINSLLPPREGRTAARHTVTLDHEALSKAVERLMTKGGTASFIMPPGESDQFKRVMEAKGFETTRVCRFRTRAGKKVERVMMTFMRAEGKSSLLDRPTSFPREEEILLYAEGDEWTAKYSALTQDLYLPRAGSFPKSDERGSN
ncbi:methyltransferase [Chryseolinea sp. T2]|uniref:tRNA1(Val) (adenine(37)-N6)-methyltransferase n=1 Tax=Chryseolinea sp. T2 TaxID=3129255 RepID=UPI0030772CF1